MVIDHGNRGADIRCPLGAIVRDLISGKPRRRLYDIFACSQLIAVMRKALRDEHDLTGSRSSPQVYPAALTSFTDRGLAPGLPAAP